MPYKIERILVPVDFSETSEFAINTAASMAKLLKAELFFIHVIEFKEYYYSVLPETKTIMPNENDIKIAAKKKLFDIQTTIKSYSGIKPNIFITSGNIESEIREYAQKENIDLILMGTHGTSGYQELFIGSNAQRVVTLSDIPVLTLQKEKGILGFKNILIAIDNSLRSREKVNIAAKIAELYAANVHILGVLDSTDEVELKKFKIKLKSVEEHLSSLNLHYQTQVLTGDNIAKMALTYAEDNKCDLMVINTGHESKITGVFLGAFAQQIVNHSTIPVLSVKPHEDAYSATTAGLGVS